MPTIESRIELDISYNAITRQYIGLPMITKLVRS